MIKYLSGVFTVLFLLTILNYFNLRLLSYPNINSEMEDKIEDIIDITILTLNGKYATHALTGRCTKDIKIEMGEVTRRQWFDCGAVGVMVSDFLFGEYEDK